VVKFCPKCGSELKDTDEFCYNCGHKFTDRDFINQTTDSESTINNQEKSKPEIIKKTSTKDIK
jgi:uncharacterized membrane protein YvbJ